MEAVKEEVYADRGADPPDEEEEEELAFPLIDEVIREFVDGWELRGAKESLALRISLVPREVAGKEAEEAREASSKVSSIIEESPYLGEELADLFKMMLA